MQEIRDIFHAYRSLCDEDKRCALATVIGVEGSSYRRPGAKMLIAPDGRTWGGVSGGCLEQDVARRARHVIDTGEPITFSYDSRDEDLDSPHTPATGCGGIVHLFIQPLSPTNPGPLETLHQANLNRQPTCVATIISTSPDCLDLLGQIITPNHCDSPDARITALQTWLLLENEKFPALDHASYKVIRQSFDWGTIDLGIEFAPAPLSLIIFGDGGDVTPVVTLAKFLGWHVTVIGKRASQGRFPAADFTAVSSCDDPLGGVEIPLDAAVVVMTHNVHQDRAILQRLAGPLRYLGVLGPRHRTQQIVDDVSHNIAKAPRFFSPIGLDIGAQSPHEIALAVVAEIQAVIRQTSAGFLKNRPGPIYPRPASVAVIQNPATQLTPSACPI